jgi:DNA polymerase/3'-5' exonuclease PolX
LNEYGLYDVNGNYLAGKTEEEIFNVLGMKYKTPLERV